MNVKSYAKTAVSPTVLAGGGGESIFAGLGALIRADRQRIVGPLWTVETMVTALIFLLWSARILVLS